MPVSKFVNNKDQLILIFVKIIVLLNAEVVFAMLMIVSLSVLVMINAKQKPLVKMLVMKNLVNQK